jgi:thioredoxin 1
MQEVNNAAFKAEVLAATTPVLVDFWAPWCGPCRMVSPIVEEIAKDYEGKLKVVKINVDDSQELAAQYGIMSIPTLCLFKNGECIERLIGLRQKKEIAAIVDQVLGS